MKIDDELIPYLDKLFKHAKENVTFYKELYVNSPSKIDCAEDFYKLPQINESLFIRHRLEDMITSYDDIYKVAYPDKKFINDSTIPRVFNLEDLDNQYEILDWILDECGSFEEGAENRVALIMDESSSYEMGEIGQMLALMLECPVFAMVLRGHAENEIAEELLKMNSNTVFTMCSLSDTALTDAVKKVYTIGPECKYVGDKESINIWTNPYLGFIGYRKMGEEVYNINSDFYLLETNEREQIILTSFMQNIMPMIRYQSRNYGKCLDNETVMINYWGTH